MKNHSDYYCRLYELGDEEGIVDLLKIGFNEWKVKGSKSLSHWRWKYLDNPLGTCTIAVVKREDEIVAAIHDIHLEMKIGDKIEEVLYTTDLITHPDHRRKGLMGSMWDLRQPLQKNTSFVYNYYSNKILIDRIEKKRKENERTSFRIPVEINRYLLIDNIDLHLSYKRADNPWLKKYGYNVKKWFSSLQNLISNSKKSSSGIEIQSGLDLDAYQMFWSDISSRYVLIANKNTDFVKWRFLDPRSGDYHVYSGYRDGKYYGYIVASIDYETPDYPMGNIVDFMTYGDLVVDSLLLQRGLACLLELGVNAVSANVVKNSSISHVLESAGFLNVGDSLYSTYYTPNNPGMSHPVMARVTKDNIHLMYSDYYVK